MPNPTPLISIFEAYLYIIFRIRIFRQPSVCSGRYPGNEWVSNWDETTEGPAEETEGCPSALLTKNAVPARLCRAHGMYLFTLVEEM